MARRIIRQETIDGTLYNVVEDDAVTVLTGPNWLFNMFNDFTHPVKPWHKIKPVIDPDGKPIIGMSVLDDSNWDFLAVVPVVNPETQEGKQVRDWLIPINHVYLEEVQP
jgi:hypothetical protein